MNRPPTLPESLRRLGVEEVKERLELANLSLAGGAFESVDLENCCSCKIPRDPDLDVPED